MSGLLSSGTSTEHRKLYMSIGARIVAHSPFRLWRTNLMLCCLEIQDRRITRLGITTMLLRKVLATMIRSSHTCKHRGPVTTLPDPLRNAWLAFWPAERVRMSAHRGFWTHPLGTARVRWSMARPPLENGPSGFSSGPTLSYHKVLCCRFLL